MFSKAKNPQQSSSNTSTSPTFDSAQESKAEPASNPVVSSGAVPSIISADLQITGDVKSTGDIQIDGQVKGDVHSKTLTVGEAAQINGSLSGDRIRICGSVTGTVRGPAVILAKTAKVLGDIVHDSLEIEAGAFIEGNIMRMDTAKGQKSAAKAAASSMGSKAPMTNGEEKASGATVKVAAS
ncbi:MAG: polymer-forming cytoskeletal protein [Pseudomonadota bacterium]